MRAAYGLKSRVVAFIAFSVGLPPSALDESLLKKPWKIISSGWGGEGALLKLNLTSLKPHRSIFISRLILISA